VDPDQITAYLQHHGYGKPGEPLEAMAQRWAADRPTSSMRKSGATRNGGADSSKILAAIEQEMQSMASNTASAGQQDDSGRTAQQIGMVADDIIPAVIKAIH
jgi:hypothetical protein